MNSIILEFSEHPFIFIGFGICYFLIGTTTASWLQFDNRSVPVRVFGLFFWPFVWLYILCYLIISCIPDAVKGFINIFRD